MKKNFTKLMCVGIACFCMVSAIGQKNKPFVGENNERIFLQENGFELRKGENKIPEMLPDSIITYSSAGERVLKRELIAEENHSSMMLCTYYDWENNNWSSPYQGVIYFSELNLAKNDYYLYMPVTLPFKKIWFFFN